jgi:ATP-dependent RNA/DNA helicase IGHMBP2
LLVLGDSATIGAHPYYADFLAHAEATGAWLSAWADDAPPFGE